MDSKDDSRQAGPADAALAYRDRRGSGALGGLFRVKIERRLPSGATRSHIVLKESAGDYEGSAERFLAEPSFSERLAKAMAAQGLLFESIVTAHLVTRRGKVFRTVQFTHPRKGAYGVAAGET